MHDLPFFMKSPWFFIVAIVTIILSYFGMRNAVKKGNKALETKTFSYGLYYMFKPAHGEEAVKLARAYKRIGYIVFGFIIFLFVFIGVFFRDAIFK